MSSESSDSSDSSSVLSSASSSGSSSGSSSSSSSSTSSSSTSSKSEVVAAKPETKPQPKKTEEKPVAQPAKEDQAPAAAAAAASEPKPAESPKKEPEKDTKKETSESGSGSDSSSSSSTSSESSEASAKEPEKVKKEESSGAPEKPSEKKEEIKKEPSVMKAEESKPSVSGSPSASSSSSSESSSSSSSAPSHTPLPVAASRASPEKKPEKVPSSGNLGDLRTIGQILRNAVSKYGSFTAMRCMGLGGGVFTYEQYYREAMDLAKAIVIKIRDRKQRNAVKTTSDKKPCVLIYMENRIQYLIVNAAAILAGCLPIHVPFEYVPLQLDPIVKQTHPYMMFVDEWTERHQRIYDSFRSRMDFVMCNPFEVKSPAHQMRHLTREAEKISDAEIEALDKRETAETVCEVVLSIQEDGTDKLVMLSHRNVITTALAFAKRTGATRLDHVLSVLPLCSITQQILSIYMPMCCGSCVYFPERPSEWLTPKGIVKLLKDSQTTIFVTIPRIWEKISEFGKGVVAERDKRGNNIGHWAQQKGRAGVEAFESGKHKPRGFGIARRHWFRKIRAELGMAACKYCGVFGTGTQKDALDFFLGLGVILQNVWGIPELTGLTMATYHMCWSPTSVGGPTAKDTKVKLEANNELLVAGDCVCLGYMDAEGSPERPPACFGPDGFFHTGELMKSVTINSHDAFEPTGRLHNLIYTNGCLPLAPAPIERKLRGILGVKEVMIVGDGRKFFAALFLLPRRTGWVDSTDAFLRRRIEELVNVGLSQPQQIKKFAVLRDKKAKSVSVLKSCLTAQERRKAEEHYKNLIDMLYSPNTKYDSEIPNLDTMLNPDAMVRDFSDDWSSASPTDERSVSQSSPHVLSECNSMDLNRSENNSQQNLRKPVVKASPMKEANTISLSSSSSANSSVSGSS